jgi:hypothetical protein
MSNWKEALKADPLPWLLERDNANPGVRTFALRDLLDRPIDDPEVIAAQAATMRTGPIPAILDAQYPQGYWVKPGPGYSPKYRSTLWSLIFLAQLGADGRDVRVRRGAEHVFAHAQTESGAFSCNGRPGGVIYCLWGNVARALLDLGYWGDPRLERSVDVLARAVLGVGDGHAHPRGTRDAGFACDANQDLPCAWGAVRVLWALNGVPPSGRTPVMEDAIAASVDFLLRYDLATAAYPTATRVSPGWFKFGYPLAYVTDILLVLEVLAQAGCGDDPRLTKAVDLVLSKQDDQGRWRMEHSYNPRMWTDIERKGEPSKWVTLRATRMLKRLSGG